METKIAALVAPKSSKSQLAPVVSFCTEALRAILIGAGAAGLVVMMSSCAHAGPQQTASEGLSQVVTGLVWLSLGIGAYGVVVFLIIALFRASTDRRANTRDRA